MDRTLIGLAAAASLTMAGLLVAPVTGASPPDDPGAGSARVSRERRPVLSDSDLIAADILDDPTVSLTSDGLLVAEPALVGPIPPLDVFDERIAEITTGGAGASLLAAGAGALELHSRPGADLVLHLDFDGHTTSGTSWNSWKGVDPIVSAPYSLDTSPAFSPQELDNIADIWSIVAEDYAPFDVDVTTEDPGPAALALNGPDDGEYGLRIVISPTSGWYGRSGGVAYVNSFWDSIDRPAFVFSDNLGASWKAVGEAASHEGGHGLGLLHDGVSGGSAYYAGHGDWAPIMGVGYTRLISQWSKGEYSGADNTGQDDVALLAAGLGLIPPAGVTALSDGDSVVGTVRAAGEPIEFTFAVAQGGPVDITVRPALANYDLLARVDVFDQGGAPVATATPTDDAGWVDTISQQFPAGTYRVAVTGIGWRDPRSTGFSDYASLGRFVLDIDLADATTTTTSTTSTTTTSPSTTTTSTTTTSPPTTTTSTTSTTSPSTTTTSTVPPIQRPPTSRLTPVTSTRLLDTRAGKPGASRLQAGETLVLAVAGRGPTPATATAAVLNTAAVDPAADGFISLTACDHGSEAPRTSTLNFKAGSNTANSAIATLDASGDVCIYASVATDVIVDLTGWLDERGAVGMRVIEPFRRAVDSRQGIGGIARLKAGRPVTVDLSTHVSPGATAAAVNLTVDNTAAIGFVSAYLCAAGWNPGTSVLNHGARETRANNAILALGPARTFCVVATADTDLIVDVTAEFGPAGDLEYLPSPSVRVLDTRGGDLLPAGASIAFSVPAPPPGIGAAAGASMVITATGHTGRGFVTAWGCGPRPGTSTLNPMPRADTANSAIANLGTGRRACLFTTEETELIVDFGGWWV